MILHHHSFFVFKTSFIIYSLCLYEFYSHHHHHHHHDRRNKLGNSSKWKKTFPNLNSIKKIERKLMSHAIVVMLLVVVVVVTIVISSFPMLLNWLMSMMLMIMITYMLLMITAIIMRLIMMMEMLLLWRLMMVLMIIMMIMMMLVRCRCDIIIRRRHACLLGDNRLLINYFHLFKFFVCGRHQLSSAGSIRRGL
jgi:hypothetical protein